MPKIAASITDRERIVLADILTNAQIGAEDNVNALAAFREFDLELAAANIGARPPMSYQNTTAAAVEVSADSAAFVLKLIEAKVPRAAFVPIVLSPFAERLRASLAGGQ